MNYLYEQREQKERRAQMPANLPPLRRDLRDEVGAYLTRRGLDAELAFRNRWYPTVLGDGYARVVMLATNQAGLSYWQARLIGDAPTEIMRYASPPVPRADSIIIVYPLCLPTAPYIVLVEGPMDALAVAGAGYIGVALMGNRPADEAFQHLCNRFPATDFLIVPDSDSIECGPSWALSLYRYGRKSVINLLPVGCKDLASLAKSEREVFLRSAG